MIDIIQTIVMLCGIWFLLKTVGSKIYLFNFNKLAPWFKDKYGQLKDPADDNGASYMIFSVGATVVEVFCFSLIVLMF